MRHIFCPTCGTDTPHTHTHECAHGISATHLAGSECFSCTVCLCRTGPYDPLAAKYPFVLDKPVMASGAAP